MRIALFSDAYHPRVSGLVTSIDEFGRALASRGHQLCIVCPSYPEREMQGLRTEFSTIRVPAVSALVSRGDRLAIPWHENEATARLDHFNPDVVHVQTEFSIGSFGRKYCRKRQQPILSTCHTMYEMYMKGYLPWLTEKGGRRIARHWLRATYANDEIIIAPTRRIRDVMRSYGLDKEYLVIPTGVDDAAFYPRSYEAAEFRRELCRKYPGFGDGPLLMYAGRIGREKHLDLLFRAMTHILREMPSTWLLMVGDGPARQELHQYCRMLGVGDKVAWIGFQPRERMPGIYSAADIFVFPSMTETQGLVTIEAMLCGTPVVGVDRMGTAEIMKGDHGGLLSNDDEIQFAQRCLRMLREPELRADKSADARRHALRWSIKNTSRLLEAVYRRVAYSRTAIRRETIKGVNIPSDMLH